MPTERLQKILARAGIASRRAAEEIIVAGRVRVNGKVVRELGVKADPFEDRIEFDGRRIVAEGLVYLVLHKPRGVVSTLSDPEGRPSLGELLARYPERLYPVGRLDFHTSGALLITNDGELAEALLHPSRKVPKVYVAKMRGDLDTDALDGLRNGVELDDGFMTAPADVIVLREEAGSTWIRITIHEGKNRQILRMGDAIGHPVTRLARISFAGLDTEALRPGNLRQLEEKEIEKLKKTYLVPARARKLGQKRSAARAARAATDEVEGDPGDDGLDEALSLGDDLEGEAEAAEWHADSEGDSEPSDGDAGPSFPRERSRTPRVTKRAREMERGVQNARGKARDPRTREGVRASASRQTKREEGAGAGPKRANARTPSNPQGVAASKGPQRPAKSGVASASRGAPTKGRRGIRKSR